ncbi:MAG TPA: histidine kinase [Steroidobacteraceae bacterium]
MPDALVELRAAWTWRMINANRGARVILMSSTPLRTAPEAVAAEPLSSERDLWRLVFAVTIPFWIYLALMRILVFALSTAGNPGIIIAPPHIRLLQHLLLLPLLLIFYRWALQIGWPPTRRTRAALKHTSMALLFAVVARPILVALVAFDRNEPWLMRELFASEFGPRMSFDLWASTMMDFLLSYGLGLAILLGVRNYQELKYHQLRAANLQAAWTHSRLQALRMQLNPHFLFNTLNAAVALVSSQPKAAEQMLVRLADLLRRTLRDGEEDFISILREADFVRNYLEVQRLRFPDRLSFNVEIDPSAVNAAVPSLILQPLAENAVVHSVAADAEKIHVDVHARRVSNGIELSVRNSASAAQSDPRLGVGLGNTRERLKTLFEDDHELELIRDNDGSVIARVRIPFIEHVTEKAA